MTLKLTRFLEDALNKEAVISHWGSNISVGKPEQITESIKTLIKKQFGELYLESANFVISTPIQISEAKRASKKLAQLVGRVFTTDVDPSEVKLLDTTKQNDDEDGSTITYAMIVVTTK